MAKWDGIGNGRRTTELIGTGLFVGGLVILVAAVAYGLIWVFS